MKNSSNDRPLVERVDDVPLILHAMRQGVREALARHRERGNPVVVWRDGHVVWIRAEDIPIELTTPLPELR